MFRLSQQELPQLLSAYKVDGKFYPWQNGSVNFEGKYQPSEYFLNMKYPAEKDA